MSKKYGFNLAEVIITLVIIGVIITLMLRITNRASVDADKMLYVKTYRVLDHIIYDIINDPNKYSQEYGATSSHDFSQAPLSISVGKPPIVRLNDVDIVLNKDSALCYYVAEKLQTKGKINCESNGAPNFTTSNGVIWSGLYGAIGATPNTITVDVCESTGIPDDQCDDKKGRYQILVYRNGKIAPPTTTGRPEADFLKQQTDMRAK